MDPLPRIVVSQPANPARAQAPSDRKGPVTRSAKRRAARPAKKKGMFIRVPPPPLARSLSSPPLLSAAPLPPLSMLSPQVLLSPKPSPPPSAQGTPLMPMTPATPAWPMPMGSEDGRKVQACDSDDDVDELVAPKAPSEGGQATGDDDASSVASSAYLKEADALARIVRRRMPPVLGLLWDGDDDRALSQLLRGGSVNIYERGGPLGVNSIVLAHRLGRARCAKTLFSYAFDTSALPPEPVHQALPQPMQKAIAQRNAQRKAHEAQRKATLYARCQNDIRAKLEGNFGHMYACSSLVHQALEGHEGGPAVTPRQRALVHGWIRAGVLGHLLNHFDQDALLKGGSPCAHWPQLLSETALALDYPLDKDHLLIGFGLSACGGAPEPG